MKDLFKALQRKKARREYLKSMLAGILSTVVDFFLTAVFLYFFYHNYYDNFFLIPISSAEHVAISVFIVSTMIAWIAGFILNYALCIFFVFQYGNVGKSRLGFIKFLIFGLIGVTITAVLTAIAIALGMHPWLAKLLVTLVVFVFNFFTRKYFIFNIALIHDEENVIRL